MSEKSAVIATGVTREGFVSPDGFNGGESISVVSEGGILSAFISSVSPSYGSSVSMDDFFVTRVKKNGEWEEVDNILASKFFEYGIENEISLTRNIGGTWNYQVDTGGVFNLTPHPLNLVKQDGQVIEIAPSGQLARVEQLREERRAIAGMTVTYSSFGDVVTGLPDPAPGKIFVVSALVLAHPSVQNRIDVFCPGEAVRDEAGKIIGAKGLSCTSAYKY